MGACVKPSYVTPTDHERAEWDRMAAACDKSERPGLAGLYRAAAVLIGPMTPWTYDALQKSYRRWLVSGIEQFVDDSLLD
jgi:hypothetical protein